MRGYYIKKGRRNSLNLSLEGKLNERASREALSDRLATRACGSRLLSWNSLGLKHFCCGTSSTWRRAPHLEQMAQLSKHRRRERALQAEPLAGCAPWERLRSAEAVCRQPKGRTLEPDNHVLAQESWNSGGDGRDAGNPHSESGMHQGKASL